MKVIPLNKMVRGPRLAIALFGLSSLVGCTVHTTNQDSLYQYNMKLPPTTCTRLSHKVYTPLEPSSEQTITSQRETDTQPKTRIDEYILEFCTPAPTDYETYDSSRKPEI